MKKNSQHKPIKLFNPLNNNKIQVLAYICDLCNYNCWYCYNQFPRTKKILNLNQLKRFIHFLHEKTNKIINLGLIGGEPTLHPDLYDFCKKTVNNFVIINIYSNFSQPLDYYQKLLDINCQFSLTYHHQNIDFLNKVLNLGRDNQKNQFDIVVMYEPKYCNESLDMFKNLLKNYPHKKNITLSLVLDDTSNKIMTKYSEEQLSMYKKAIEDADQPAEDFFVQFDDGKIEKLTYNDLQVNHEYCCKNWLCNAGIEYFDVDINGNVYACQTYNKQLFNINDDTYNLPQKPIICKSNYCQCRWDITKKKIFK